MDGLSRNEYSAEGPTEEYADPTGAFYKYLPTPREGHSPFLEGTCIQFAYDSTSLGALKKCPRFYQLFIIEGWRPKGDNVNLRFGILYHKGLELYDRMRAQGTGHEDSLVSIVAYLLGETWEREVDNTGDYVDAGRPWQTGRTDKNRFTLIRSVVWYLDQFGENDPAETVLLENGKPAVELSFKMELDWGPEASMVQRRKDLSGYDFSTVSSQPYLLCGHLDRIVSFVGGKYVMDRKTTKTTISQNYFNQFEPSNQMTLYTIAAKIIFHTPVKGVIIDGAQIAVGFTRFARGFTYRTDAQLEEFLTDLHYWFGAAEYYAIQGYWPMNDTACFLCQFRGICSKDPAVRANFLEGDFTKEDPWNPLKQR